MDFVIKNMAVDGDSVRGSVTDNPVPMFSWAAEHSEDARHQAAYRVTVRTAEKEKWDSGWVEDTSQRAVYAGETLETGEELFWTVRIRDDEGKESDEGQGCFAAALMDGWTAAWITTPWDKEGEAKYFRKQIFVERKVKKAWLYVCGIGYQHITLNGKEVDDACLQPAVSHYGKHCYYVSLPVRGFLHPGENSLDVIVGEGWRRNHGEYLKAFGRPVEFFGIPKLTAQLQIVYEDGEELQVCTDESWVCGRGPIRFNHLFDGEEYDERVETAYTHRAVLCKDSSPQMKAQTIRPIMGHESFLPRVKRKVDKGYVFDFGTNIAGIVEVLVPAGMAEGTEVKIYHVENILPDGRKDGETIRKARAMDMFVCGGEKKERLWRPKFVYHGFRYIYVEGWEGIPDVTNFRAIALYTDVKNHSFFQCGSPVVNQIQECIVQTEKNNLHSIATDCPQRDERMGWLNDATVRFEGMPYHFQMHRLFAKIMDDIAAEQSPDGAIPCTAPFIYGCRPADPVSSSFLIAALENYLHYGGTADIRKHYQDFKRWNECLKAHSEDGIVTYSHWGDWAGPADCCRSCESAESAMTPGILMSTGFHYYNYRLLQRFAKILGDEEEAALNAEEAERVRQAFQEEWWREEAGVVDSGSAGSQAFALWLGILPQEQRAKAAAVMEEAVRNAGCRITTGNLNTRYVMDMLAEYGYVDTAWELMTREAYPSWGYMLQNGATTIWERFEFKRGSGMNSHDHPMYGAVGYWLYGYIVGIRPGEDGWQKFRVQPYLPEKLLYAEAGVETSFGTIYLKWQKQLGMTDILLDVPFGTTAQVKLPWGEEMLVKSGYHHFHHPL